MATNQMLYDNFRYTPSQELKDTFTQILNTKQTESLENICYSLIKAVRMDTMIFQMDFKEKLDAITTKLDDIRNKDHSNQPSEPIESRPLKRKTTSESQPHKRKYSKWTTAEDTMLRIVYDSFEVKTDWGGMRRQMIRRIPGFHRNTPYLRQRCKVLSLDK
jgi:hypothetical protein